MRRPYKRYVAPMPEKIENNFVRVLPYSIFESEENFWQLDLVWLLSLNLKFEDFKKKCGWTVLLRKIEIFYWHGCDA